MRLQCAGRVGVHTGFLRDLSAGGMFLRLVDPEAVGIPVGFEISLPDRRVKVRGTGEVAWSRPAYGGPGRPPGMAVRFVTLEPAGAAELTAVLGVAPRARVVDPAAVEAVVGGEGREGEGAGEGGLFGTGSGDGDGSRGRDLVRGVVEGAVETAAAAGRQGDAAGGGGLGGGGEGAVVTSTTGDGAAVGEGARTGSEPRRRLLPWGLLLGVLLAGVVAAVWLRREAAPAPGAGGTTAPADAAGRRAAGPVASLPMTGAPDASGRGALTSEGPSAAGAEAAATAPAAAAPARRLVDVRWEARAGGGTVVTLSFDGAVDPARITASRIGGESPRELVEIAGMAPERPGPWRPATAEVRMIRTGYHAAAEPGQGELHVVFDLAAPGVANVGLTAAGSELRCELAPR